MSITREEILALDYSTQFDELRQNRIVQSYYKYGLSSENYPTGLVDAIESLYRRLDLYKKTGNLEMLVDAANFAMLEFMHSRHPNKHFKSLSSDEAPKIVGISSKELLEFEGGFCNVD